MSAGNFTTGIYQADYNQTTLQFHPIRVQPETLEAEAQSAPPVTNVAAGTPVNNPISAVTSRGRRAKGLNPRKVFIKVIGTPPTGYSTNSTTVIPALTPDFYTACVTGVAVTYLGADWEVTGRSPEFAK